MAVVYVSHFIKYFDRLSMRVSSLLLILEVRRLAWMNRAFISGETEARVLQRDTSILHVLLHIWALHPAGFRDPELLSDGEGERRMSHFSQRLISYLVLQESSEGETAQALRTESSRQFCWPVCVQISPCGIKVQSNLRAKSLCICSLPQPTWSRFLFVFRFWKVDGLNALLFPGNKNKASKQEAFWYYWDNTHCIEEVKKKKVKKKKVRFAIPIIKF